MTSNNHLLPVKRPETPMLQLISECAASAVTTMLFVLLAAVSLPARAGDKSLGDYLKNLPFEMPRMSEPKFPDRRVSIVDCGAIADGRFLNTAAFDSAIRSCAAQGGGTVVVPPGTWLTGPITLVSNINLYLERGALIQFSRRIGDFPLIAGFDGKSKRFLVTPPIHAFRATNIAITGEGVIDGAGEAWRYVKREKLTARQWKDLTLSGGVVSVDGKTWWPSKEALDAEQYLLRIESSGKKLSASEYAQAREYLRPDLVRLVQCNGILLDGPTFTNSPRFHLYPYQSENIIVRNINIVTEWYAQNGDGLDLGSCRNVAVYNVTVNAGDDAICLKPGTIASNQEPGPACENIVIADCVVYHGHGGFVIGSETKGGVRNVSVRNCVFLGTDVGLRFKSARGKGGTVENIFIDGIRMREIDNEAILFDLYYGDGEPEVSAVGDKETAAVTEETPSFRNIVIRNVTCSGARRAVLINGLPEMPVRNVRLEHVDITSATGVLIVDADSVSVTNSTLTSATSPIVAVNQGKNLTLSGVGFPERMQTFLSVAGERTEGIRLLGIDLKRAIRAIEFDPTARREAVVGE